MEETAQQPEPEADRSATTRDRGPDQAFGRVLLRYRKAKRLTQEQLAWSTGMSRVYISDIERGLREPGLGTMLKLARALEVPAWEMMREVEGEIPTE
jgi:transcriptional regulator with XRE-family HTH domain